MGEGEVSENFIKNKQEYLVACQILNQTSAWSIFLKAIIYVIIRKTSLILTWPDLLGKELSSLNLKCIFSLTNSSICREMLIKAQWVAYFESFGGDTENQFSEMSFINSQITVGQVLRACYPNSVDCNTTDKVYTRGRLPSVSIHCQNSNLLTGMWKQS